MSYVDAEKIPPLDKLVSGSHDGRMKGQYLILGEILLFAFGLAIANYVIFSFQRTEGRTNEVALKDNFQLIANMLSTAVIKTSESANSSVRFFLPEKISGRTYAISFKSDSVIVFDLDNPEVNVIQKLFNITQGNCISDNAFCSSGDVVSTAKSIEVFSDGKTVILRRLRIT